MIKGIDNKCECRNILISSAVFYFSSSMCKFFKKIVFEFRKLLLSLFLFVLFCCMYECLVYGHASFLMFNFRFAARWKIKYKDQINIFCILFIYFFSRFCF